MDNIEALDRQRHKDYQVACLVVTASNKVKVAISSPMANSITNVKNHIYERSLVTTTTRRNRCHCDRLNDGRVSSTTQQINRFFTQALIGKEIYDRIVDI